MPLPPLQRTSAAAVSCRPSLEARTWRCQRVQGRCTGSRAPRRKGSCAPGPHHATCACSPRRMLGGIAALWLCIVASPVLTADPACYRGMRCVTTAADVTGGLPQVRQRWVAPTALHSCGGAAATYWWPAGRGGPPPELVGDLNGANAAAAGASMRMEAVTGRAAWLCCPNPGPFAALRS